MPLYHFYCTKCFEPVRRILTVEEGKKEQYHNPMGAKGVCRYALKRTPRAPSNQVVEILDNGLMPKRVERLAEAERLFQERNKIENKKRRGE